MLEDLNQAQKEAILEVDGPTIVFAGAGSGKTRTLTYRIAYMINEKKINPLNILAITFTNKAANEMKERLVKLLTFDAHMTTICTFHSLCAKILRRDIDVLGYDKSFSIIDDEEQLKIIGEVLAENDYDKKLARSFQKTIGYLKCFDMKSTDPFDNKILGLYEEKMQSLNLLDFDDLLIKVKQLFLYHKDILNKYRQRYQYILVDEFQDTNLIQYQIVKMLAQEHRNLFVVGDDDQSIYSFRGANYENTLLFKKDFPEFHKFTLTQNYRSSQIILDGCNRLISNNKEREKKELFSEIAGTNKDVTIFEANNERDEVEYVLNEIASLKNEENSYENFAILYRSSVLLRNFELGLIRYNMPYKVYGGISYLRRREIKDVIAYLKLIINHNDLHSFKRIINVPSRNIGSSSVEKIEKIKKEYKLNLFDALDSCKSIFPKSKFDKLMEFKDLIIEFRNKMEETDLLTLFDELIDRIEYVKYLKDEDDDADDRLANLQEFKSILYQVENDGEIASRADKLKFAFDEAILSDDYLQNQKENKYGITVSTIHSVKGLEFDYVFLVGLEDSIFPNSFKIDENFDLEEERRVAYVACTRARRRLYFTLARQRMLYGTYFKNGPSIFLLEFLGKHPLSKKYDNNYEYDDLPIEERMVEVQKKEIPMDNQPKDPSIYRLGDEVTHTIFGDGVIVAIDGNVGQIFFNSEKRLVKLDLTHPALNKKNKN